MLKLTKKEMDRLKEFLQWEDRNGCYTDENCEIEDMPILDEEGTLKYVIKVLNFEEFENSSKDIQEMEFEEIEEFLKSKELYEITIDKINTLKENDKNITLYRKLI